MVQIPVDAADDLVDAAAAADKRIKNVVDLDAVDIDAVDAASSADST